jgi:hypothetical protein
MHTRIKQTTRLLVMSLLFSSPSHFSHLSFSLVNQHTDNQRRSLTQSKLATNRKTRFKKKKMVLDNLPARTTIFLSWLALTGFSLAYAISAFATANLDDFIRAWKFYYVWTGITVLVFAAVIPLVFARFLTALSYGSLIGSSFFLAQLMLVTAVISGRAASDLEEPRVRSVTAFASILFPGYLAYMLLLVMFKDHVLEGAPGYQIRGKTTGTGAPTNTYVGSTTGAPVAGSIGTGYNTAANPPQVYAMSSAPQTASV